MIKTLAFLMFVVSVNAMTVLGQTATKPVKAGEVAPDFTLVDHRGNKQTLSDSKGKNPVVIVFYRGYW